LDECLVDLSTDGGETWIALRGEYGEAPSGDSGGWVIENLILSDYVGQIVQVRFYFETFDSANNALPGWFIDDVRIGAQGTPWVSVFPEEGIAEPGETAEVLVTFDSLEYRPPGDYEALIRVETNDPFGPRTEIPTTLRIHDTPRLILPGEPVTEESILEFSGATTHHELLLSTPPAGGGEIRLEVQGDFTRPGRTATAIAEFVPLGTLGGSSGATEENCGTVAMVFPIDGDALRALVTDGRLEVDFRNSDGVTPNCPTNVHAAQLTYRAPRQAVDFGENPAGSPTVQLLRIENDGDGALRIDSVTTGAPGVTIVPTDLTLAPRASVDLELTWTPDAASELSHELRIVSNDPENPLATLNLKGSATDPLGRIELTPQEIVAALPPGSDLVKLKVVQLSNTGEGDFSWRAEPNAWTSVRPDTGIIRPGGFVELELRLTSLALDSGDYEDVVAITSNDPVNPRIELPVTLHVKQVELTSFSVNLSPKFAERPGTVEVSFQAPDGFETRAVDVSTVSMHGVYADASPVVYRDMDQDGREDIVLQFDRAALVAALPTGSPVLVTLGGEVRDLAWFEGSVYIRGVAEIGSD